MRNLFIAATLVSLTASHALAAEPQQTNKTGRSLAGDAAGASNQPSAQPHPASLVNPDEPVMSGDLINIGRRFDNWLLRCDLRLSQNKRLCSIDQQVDDGQGDRLLWRIAQNAENKPIVLISAPANLIHSRGMRLGFAGLEKTIHEKDWLCSEKRCQSGFHFEGLLQIAILNTDLMHFSYWLASTDGREREINTTGSMKGFAEAIRAAARDPFGRDVTANSSDTKTRNPSKSPGSPNRERSGGANGTPPHKGDR